MVYGGAEYMLTQTALAHPGFIDEASRTNLYARGPAVLVRPGNPLHIKRLEDLARPGVRLLDVNGAGQMGLTKDMARTPARCWWCRAAPSTGRAPKPKPGF